MVNRQDQIAEAANAFKELSDDATADEIADSLTVGLETLADILSQYEISDRTAARLIPRWKYIQSALRTISNSYATQIARRLLEANNGKALPVVVESDNGEQVVCTPKISVRRSEVARDDLVAAVERAAGKPQNRLNPNGTGELLDHDQAKVLLFKKCFRMEPRWSDLKKIGIYDDEFCRRESSYSLDVRKGATL